MKIEVITYLHKSNGFTLEIVGETEQETAILLGLAKHGKLEVRDCRLCVDWKIEEEK